MYVKGSSKDVTDDNDIAVQCHTSIFTYEHHDIMFNYHKEKNTSPLGQNVLLLPQTPILYVTSEV